jgi:hypothetical protein
MSAQWVRVRVVRALCACLYWASDACIFCEPWVMRGTWDCRD